MSSVGERPADGLHPTAFEPAVDLAKGIRAAESRFRTGCPVNRHWRWVTRGEDRNLRLQVLAHAVGRDSPDAGSYLPVEQEKNSVIWRPFELPLTQVRVLIAATFARQTSIL